jgi:hypothetical protein
MLSEPVAQLPVAANEAVIVAVPDPTKLAVLPENVTIEVSLEVQVVEFVTSALFREAVKACWEFSEKVPLAGLITSVCAVPPVALPVIVPWTPARVAVIVTLELEPIAVTSPVVLTVAHDVELDQLAEFVTIFVPLLKVAVAVNCWGLPTATDRLLAPFCVTAIEFGWFTKKPVQAVVKEVMASAAEKNKFRFKFRMIIGPLETPNHLNQLTKL